MLKQVDLASDASAVEAAYRHRCQDDFMLFAMGLKITASGDPRMLAECIADYQRECFEDLAPNLHQVRDGDMPNKRRFWIERTKKASKDSDLAICILWLTAFPKRPFFGQIGAADRDQAGIIKRRIQDLLHYNPWLQELVEIQQNKIKHKEGMARIDIMSSDVAGAHGETPDILIVNELSHVNKWEFVQNLMDNADGVPRGMIIIATNAGTVGTEAHKLRCTVESSEDWTMHNWTAPAPWITEQNLRDAEKRSTKARFKRLWYGIWSSGSGDAFDEDDIAAVFKPLLRPLHAPESEWMYIAGMDLGVKHDHAAFIVLGIHTGYQLMRVARMRRFTPDGKTGEIDLTEVEAFAIQMHKIFRLIWLGYDPYQAKLMAQRFVQKRINAVEVPFTGTNLTMMANRLKEVIESRQLESYEDDRANLRADLGKLTIVEKGFGYKLEATSDSAGHADVGISLAICLPRAVELLSVGTMQLRDDDHLIYDDGDTKLSTEDYDTMPAELKGIYEAYDDMEKEYAPSRRSSIVDGFLDF